MEPDRDGGDTRPTCAVQDSMSPEEGAPGPTDSLPTTSETSSETSTRDSLVTVRLSEPSSPHLTAGAPPSTIPAKSSPLTNYESSDAQAETPEEDDDDSESEIFEPENSASKRRANLLQELGRANGEGTDDREGGNNRPGSSSSVESERVDWEELQKKEELELKERGPSNVRLPSHSTPVLVPAETDASCVRHRVRLRY